MKLYWWEGKVAVSIREDHSNDERVEIFTYKVKGFCLTEALENLDQMMLDELDGLEMYTGYKILGIKIIGLEM